MSKVSSTSLRASVVFALLPLASCSGAESAPTPPPTSAEIEAPRGASSIAHGRGERRTERSGRSWQEEADDLLDFYDPAYRALSTESARAAGLSSTEVSPEHTGG
ncbi:MAG: hypothetical protein ACK6CU_00760, partial [Deltaproteobacteria bacterium]